MPAVSLQVFFYGLIAFVPGTTTFTALLVNAPLNTSVFHVHQPLLAIPMVNLVGPCNQVGSIFINPAEPTCAWPLSSQRVVLPASADPLTLTTGRRPMVNPWTPSPMPSSPAEAEDVTWLTAVRENAPGAGSIAPQCLTPIPTCGVNNTSVVARVDVTAGVVRTCHLSADQNDKVYPFEFVDQPHHRHAKPVNHAIADGMGVSMSITSFKIQLQSFDGLTTTDIDTKADSHGVIRVFVLNVPPQMPGTDFGDDFALLYDLSQPGTSFPYSSRFIPHTATKPPPMPGVEPANCYASFAFDFIDALAARAHLKKTTPMKKFTPNLRPICPMAMYSP